MASNLDAAADQSYQSHQSRIPNLKEPSTGGFLSKITRSPSRKHRAQPSVLQARPPGADVTIPFLEPQTTSSQSHTVSTSQRTNPRPGFQRTPSAPAAPLSSSRPAIVRVEHSFTIAKDDNSPRSAVQADTNFLVTLPVKGTSAILNRGTGSTPNLNSIDSMQAPSGGSSTAPPMSQGHSQGSAQQNPGVLYTHIHDMSNKRIATLNYLRKAHEGRIYWFQTVHFSKSDLSRLPSFTPTRLSRRATNYFLLGLSIPAVLDVHRQQPHAQSSASDQAAVAQDFLKSLYNLLNEFESFQQLHPPDGSGASSLSRARIPQMFKRATQTTNKPRRSSSAAVADIGLPMQQPTAVSPPGSGTGDSAHHHHHQPRLSVDTSYTSTSFSSSASTLVAPSMAPPTSLTTGSYPPSSSFPASLPYDAHANSSLLPNEGPYSHLLTPPLPCAPDFYCVFATLCDVLIDAYQRLLQLISSPAVCTVSVGEMFAKTDARLRKVIVGGIVQEFGTAARDGAKRELLGVQRMVLGGLMGVGV